MKTHGNHHFFGFIYVRGAPFIHTAPTTETESPYRTCPESIIVRLGPKSGAHALVLGTWQKTDITEESSEMQDHLLGALQGRQLDGQEEQGTFTRIREAIFRSRGQGPEDEHL